MKITMTENSGCFAFNMEAENIIDAALLVRFAVNRTVEVRYANTYACEDGKFHGSLVIGKAKNATSEIRK